MASGKPPREIALDLDATDDPLHGDQEVRFFHGYYDRYGYPPLYVFCGRRLLAAKLRRSNIDASAGSVEEMDRIIKQIRGRRPKVKIAPRADSGFAREALMSWCEDNRVDYVFGLARNERLQARIKAALSKARALLEAASGKPARVYRDFLWSTKEVLVAQAPGDRQGGMDRRRGQSALRRHLVEGRRLRIAFASACPWAEEWRLCAQRLMRPRLSSLKRVAAARS